MATVLITGANRGIGLELARQLKARGDSVIAVCREASSELKALGVRIEEGIELTAANLPTLLQNRIKDTAIDWVINNAGVLCRETLEELNLETIRQQFEVNSLAPLRVTHALLGNLHEGAKVMIVTSRMGSIADNTSGKMYGYRMSKAAVNMAGVSLAQDLKPRGIAVGLFHPGYVRTQMTGFHGNADPTEAAAQLIARFDGLQLATTGSFWHANGETLPW